MCVCLRVRACVCVCVTRTLISASCTCPCGCLATTDTSNPASSTTSTNTSYTHTHTHSNLTAGSQKLWWTQRRYVVWVLDETRDRIRERQCVCVCVCVYTYRCSERAVVLDLSSALCERHTRPVDTPHTHECLLYGCGTGCTGHALDCQLNNLCDTHIHTHTHTHTSALHGGGADHLRSAATLVLVQLACMRCGHVSRLS